MNYEKSVQAYKKALKYIPGGVNSPVRAFKSVGLDPIFIDRAHGSKIYDVDGNEYVDYICSWGPLMLGHSPKVLVEGIEEVVRKGISYGIPTVSEVEVANIIVDAYPSIDKVRMVNSGTEATMSALRVARGFTKRDKVIKFEGCYHGHSDPFLVKSGSGALTYGVPTSPGVPKDIVKNTIVGKFNDIEDITSIFKKQGEEVAAIIVETVAANMGVVSATKKFLQTIRDLATKYGAVLIFDEVITGFRLDYQSSIGHFGIKPDMACFGKIIGAGMPVGAYGGKKEIMDLVSPAGPVYQAGTLSGNPLAMHMGKKNLEILRDNPQIYTELEAKAQKLANGLTTIIKSLDLDYTVNRVGSLVCLFFTTGEVNNYEDVIKCDLEMFNKYFKALLKRGVLIAPSQFEAMFLSNAHSEEDIAYTLSSCREALIEAHKA